MISTKRVILGIQNRIRFGCKKAELSLRRRIAHGTLWIDYGWMRLPYHGDGDKQEIYYHLDGAAWWDTEAKRLAGYIKPGASIVDVGANLGFLTALFSRLATPTGLVHSFEPSPDTFRKLQEVIVRNGLKNVHAHNLGCGEQQERLQLFCMPSSGNSSLRRPNCPNDIRAVQEVSIVRLDEYLAPQLSRLDFLKIDTEGHEDAVIAGAGELIAQYRPTIYLELTSEYIESSRRAVSLLKAAGYRFLTEPVLENCHNGQNFIAVRA
jgi:FkbM family methyltransferase